MLFYLIFVRNTVILNLQYGVGGVMMAYAISCGACAAECPVGAISEGDGKFEIDADVCIECGACEATCPVGAPAQA